MGLKIRKRTWEQKPGRYEKLVESADKVLWDLERLLKFDEMYS